MSIASLSGHLTLTPAFEWIGTYPAMGAFLIATCVEIAAYYIPWLDNALDAIEIPAAVIAGTIVTASCVSGMSPFLRWTLALIAGGGVAGIFEWGTTQIRALSTATTGGVGNPIVSTGEAGASVALSILAIAIPIVVGIVVLGILCLTVKTIFKRLSYVRT